MIADGPGRQPLRVGPTKPARPAAIREVCLTGTGPRRYVHTSLAEPRRRRPATTAASIPAPAAPR